nr:hypothetical protein [Tanacetum cinerariifolium]
MGLDLLTRVSGDRSTGDVSLSSDQNGYTNKVIDLFGAKMKSLLGIVVEEANRSICYRKTTCDEDDQRMRL